MSAYIMTAPVCWYDRTFLLVSIKVITSLQTIAEIGNLNLQDNAHITLPSAATQNLAQKVEQFHAASNTPEDAEALQRLRTWLR